MPGSEPTSPSRTSRGRTLVLVVVAVLLLGGAAVAAVLATRGSDQPGPTPSAAATPSPTPTPWAARLEDFVPPVLPAVGPEALTPTGAGWALTQVWTGPDTATQWNVLYLTSPTGQASTLELPDGVTVERLVDWLPGTTLAVVSATDEELATTTSVVDLATGEVLSSRTAESGEYLEMRFVGGGSTDVVVAAGPGGDASRGEEVHTVARATADGTEVAVAEPFALSTDTVAGPLWGTVSVSSDGAYLLTSGDAGTLVLDAGTLEPVPLVMPPDVTRCDRIAWLGPSSVSASCHYYDDGGRYVRSELWRAVVGGEEPGPVLNSPSLAERGNVAGTYLTADQTVVDIDQAYGSEDPAPAGLYRLDPHDGDLVPVRTVDDRTDSDDPRAYRVLGVVGAHLLAIIIGDDGYASLALVHGENGSVQPVIEDLAVQGVRVTTVVAGP